MPHEFYVEPITNGERRSWAALNSPGNGWSGPAGVVPMAPLLRHQVHLYGKPAFKLEIGFQGLPLNVAKLDDAFWLPRRVIVQRDRGVVSEGSFRRPETAPKSIIVEELPEPRRIIPGLSYHLTTQHRGYGHLLLEGLSQAWALENTEAERIVVNQRFGGIAKALLKPLTDLPVMEVRKATGFASLLVATQSYRLDGAITGRYVELCQRIREYYAPNAIQQGVLYVSRSLATKRRLRQEPEVEERLAAMGVRILHPEQESLESQIRAFAEARVIVGPVGSALYNSVFSQPGADRIILAPDWFYTRNDALLSAFTQKAPLYIFGRSDGLSRIEGMSADWDLPTEVVIEAVCKVASI